jgi:hypothetical protein
VSIGCFPVNRPGRTSDHSSPSSAKLGMRGSIPLIPPYVFMAWCLIKHRDFIFIRQ